jgi:hypothetical protein
VDEKRDMPTSRKMLEIKLEREPGFKRFICDQCLWTIDVRSLERVEAKEGFDQHDCKTFQLRSVLA